MINPINKNKISVGRREEGEDRFSSQVSLMDTSDRLTEEYVDRYEGVKLEILNMTRFNENSDLIMTYLGSSSLVSDHKMVAEERFPISGEGFATDRLLQYWTLDTGASRSFMSKSHYLCCKSLHSLPNFASKTQRIQVGNG